MKWLSSLLIICLLALLYAGCTKKAPESPEGNNHGTCTPLFPGQQVTYNNYVKGIVTTYCTPTCHNGGSVGPGNFTTYKGLAPYAAEFEVRVIPDFADMPQGNAPLPKAIRDSLNIWVKNCSPEN